MALIKPKGQWTYEDLSELPDDGRRYEIIEGELYEMPAPNFAHAMVIANLMFALGPAVLALGGRILTAPLDVFIPGGNPVQPDLLVLLPDSLRLPSKRGIEGPPDLVIEVISPSDPDHDRLVKRALYARAGIPEYWIVSPEAAIVEVFRLEGNAYSPFCRAGNDEPVMSAVLPELELAASTVFDMPNAGAVEAS